MKTYFDKLCELTKLTRLLKKEIEIDMRNSVRKYIEFEMMQRMQKILSNAETELESPLDELATVIDKIMVKQADKTDHTETHILHYYITDGETVGDSPLRKEILVADEDAETIKNHAEELNAIVRDTNATLYEKYHLKTRLIMTTTDTNKIIYDSETEQDADAKSERENTNP